ncbi:MAG: UbiD family decarboxylase [Phycisphaeraceae bacterium]|nr:MAG: UbiD family decarboxylase [Phycisphaeraceae bacterium]
MHTSLRDFVSVLDRAGELKRITDRVSPVLEISALADLASKARAPHPGSAATRHTDPRFYDRGGPALLFENVVGSRTPVLINAFGSYRRVEMALNCSADCQPCVHGEGLESLASRIGSLVKPEPPRSLMEALAKARQFAPLLTIGPRRARRAGLCQEVFVTGEDLDLTTLPFLRCWPLDGDFASVGYPRGVNDAVPGLGAGADWDARNRGRYITLAGIHTIHASEIDDPKPASHNIGMYRVQLLGKRTLAMHWHMHHDGANHWRSWKKLGKPMPVAIALGGESVLPYAATAPLPPGISELLLAGFLNGRGIEMTRAKTVPLWVPANAEIIIEGLVRHDAGFIDYDPRTGEPLGPGAVFEGPFGDHTGFYSMPDRYPILEVTAMTHRRDPIYPTTVVGLPIQEDYFLGKATERVFLPLLKTLIPDIIDYDLPLFGAFHNCAVVQIKKHYPLHARRVMHAIWGAGQMSWTKTIFIVDDSINPHDTLAVLRACSLHCRPDRDVETVNGPLDILDHAAPRLGAGTKIGFDCTPKIRGEEIRGIPLAETRGRRTAEERAAFIDAARKIPGVLDTSWPDACGEWLFVRADTSLGDAEKPALGRVMLQDVLSIDIPGPRFVVVLGRDVDIHDPDKALFHWVANADAGRDMIHVKTACSAQDGGRLGFDATPKRAGDEANGEPVRAWPPVLTMDQEVQSRIEPIARAIGIL